MATTRHDSSGSSSVRTVTLAIAIVIVAAALRFYGLRWGLPNSLHQYSYHPDEFLTVNSAFGSVYVGHSFDPRLYNYPSLYIYLSALSMAVAFGYHAAPTLANLYLAARVVAALMGVAAVAVTYWAGRVLFSEAAGILAALILCVVPLHVQHSHFATVDVPSTVFVAAALGFCGLIMKRGFWRDYLPGGAMAGLAAGTKYNAGLVVLSVAAAHFLREDRAPGKAARLWAAFGCALAAFVASTPGSLLRTDEFVQGITYEARHAATGHGLVFAGTGSGFVYTFASSLWHGLGPALAVLFIAAVAWGLWRRDRGALMVLAFVLPYYVLISVSQVRFARYALPMFPAVAVLIGWLASDWWLRLSSARWRAVKWAWIVLLAVALLGTFVYTLCLNRLFTLPDPRDRAAHWIFSHIPKNSRIGVIEVPWFYSPPLSKNLGYGALSQRQEAALDAPYRLTIFSECEEPGCWWSGGSPPGWVVLSDYEAGDALRLQGKGSLSTADRSQVERILADLRLVSEHYELRKVFSDRLGPCDVCLGDARSLPHDMRYVSPTIRIYELRR